LLLLVGIKTTAAEQLTWNLTGYVDYVSPPFKDVFSKGDEVTYTFTFETNTIDSAPDNPSQGLYYNAIIDSEIIVGSYKTKIKNYTIFSSINIYNHYILCPLYRGWGGRIYIGTHKLKSKKLNQSSFRN